MANEIAYQIVGSGPGQITVRYSMGVEWIDLQLPWAGEGDLNEFIGRYAPRQVLLAKQVPPANLASLVGTSGSVPEPVSTPAPAPPAETPTS